MKQVLSMGVSCGWVLLCVGAAKAFTVDLGGWIWGQRGTGSAGSVVGLASGGPTDTVGADGVWNLKFEAQSASPDRLVSDAKIAGGQILIATTRTADLRLDAYDVSGRRTKAVELKGVNGATRSDFLRNAQLAHPTWIRMSGADGRIAVLNSPGHSFQNSMEQVQIPPIVDSLVVTTPDSTRTAIPLTGWEQAGISLVMASGWNPAIRYGVYFDSRDAQRYQTVRLGGLEWFAENLRYATKNGSWCQISDTCKTYGRYYDWTTAVGAGLCPSGWRVPSMADWDSLGTHLVRAGAKAPALGGVLKSSGGWIYGNSGTDAFGFRAVAAGFRASDGSWHDTQETANFWTTDPVESGAYAVVMEWSDSAVGLLPEKGGFGFGVRCVRP